MFITEKNSPDKKYMFRKKLNSNSYLQIMNFIKQVIYFINKKQFG